MPEGVEGSQPSQPEQVNIPQQGANKKLGENAEFLLGKSSSIGALPEKPSAEKSHDASTQEAARQQNKENNIDERINDARKEFDENISKLTDNLAALGNSNAEPGQGGEATQEKWKRLGDALKKAFIAEAGVLGGSGIIAAADYLTEGKYQLNNIQPFFTAANSIVGVYLSAVLGRELIGDDVKQSVKNGWEKIKRAVNLREKENKPK